MRSDARKRLEEQAAPHCEWSCHDELVEAREALARVVAVHWRYFDDEGDPGFDDTTPEPEDVWRYDRDFRAALTPVTSKP